MPPVIYQLNRAEFARLQRMITKDPEGCWLWRGRTTSNGYGKWSKGPGSPIRAAHRIVWEHHHNKPIPDGLQLDHLCRNRLCCNPDHLEPVTPSQNTMRQDHHERNKTHCPKGHEYDDTNTRLSPQGKRVCRECDRSRKRKPRINHAATPPPTPPSAEDSLGGGGLTAIPVPNCVTSEPATSVKEGDEAVVVVR